MTNFTETIRKSFSYLFEKWGFELIEIAEDYNGNVVVARSEEMKIRFINDRADFFLDVSRRNSRDTWVGFYKILDQLKELGKVDIEYKYSNKIEPVRRLLELYLPEIPRSLVARAKI